MNGIQQTVAEGLETMARWVTEGKYGSDDEFAAEYFCEDLEENVIDKAE